MEVPRLGVELELQLPATASATAMPDPSHVCYLHHSSQQHQIPSPLGRARDGTCILMGTSQIPNLLCHNRNSLLFFPQGSQPGGVSGSSTSKGSASLKKHAHMFCLLFPDVSPHLEWSEFKKIRPGNWVLLNYWLDHVDIQGWMCFATHPLQESTRALPRNSWDPRAGKGGGQSLTDQPTHWMRSWTTRDYTSNISSSHTKQKKTKNHSPSYLHKHTREKNFFLNEEKHWKHFRR